MFIRLEEEEGDYLAGFAAQCESDECEREDPGRGRRLKSDHRGGDTRVRHSTHDGNWCILFAICPLALVAGTLVARAACRLVPEQPPSPLVPLVSFYIAD